MRTHTGTMPLLALRPLNLCAAPAGSSGDRDPTAALPRTRLRPFAFAEKPGSNDPKCPQVDHYVIDDPKEAYYRVLFHHETKGDRSKSVVGRWGHLERANAWTHIVAAAIFMLWAFVRPGVLDMSSFAAQLSGVSIVATAVMFGISVVYHVYGTVPGCAAIVRNLDHIAIYMGLSAAAVADLSLVTNDFRQLPFQSIADPLLAATVLTVYFSTRRFLVPHSETREFMYADKCSLGLFRLQHSDLEHAGLRAAGSGALAFSWLLIAPAALQNLEPGVAAVWFVGAVFATMLLTIGMVVDNFYFVDDAIASDSRRCLGACRSCNSKELGCVMNSHAWWHIISFLSTSVLIAAREYGISKISKIG